LLFPFDDNSIANLRPALCLTSETGEYNHVIIAFFSSKIPDKQIESDVVIKKNSSVWQGTGLTADSVLRLHKLVTVPKSLFVRKLGRISPQAEKIVYQKLAEMLQR